MSGKVRTTWISNDIGTCPEKKVWNSVSGKYRTSLHLLMCRFPWIWIWMSNERSSVDEYNAPLAESSHCPFLRCSELGSVQGPILLFRQMAQNCWFPLIRSRTRQNFELVHINGPVQNFRLPAQNFGLLKSEFACFCFCEILGKTS